MSNNLDIPVVPPTSEERLSERELVDYRSLRESLIQWSLNIGKNPDQAEGYAYDTVRARANRLDIFYRWVWDQEDGYTATVTHEHADQYMQELAYGDSSDTHKANVQKAIKMLFKWRHHQYGDDLWDPKMSFSGRTSTQPRDFLTRDERAKIREAALEYGSTPHYKSLDPDERQEWKAYLAQRFEKPKRAIGKDDFARANGFKIPSLVWTSLDAGLRPIEVERATTSWVDVENCLLRIPQEESSKNRDNWIVSIQERTARALDEWLDERNLYPRYESTDALWLTREGNPYGSSALKYLLNRLCDIADIPTENRQMSWYAIRHSVGTYMAREEGLAAAQSQLRHRSSHTTMKYDQAPVEDRRDALDRMG